ncbi:hypothetical protein, conserved [Trypanosoma brucei brucei TREU927]|uniref:TATA-binding protein interacting (TIP20) domain-containing protein n=1 Tax=Trypanosoma brucei brucei (strain 927/4 GUTat10.1) TaxID=185431 RepID=Q387F9_TRYB2|nr:hypothetical protein, conserved [Trypanosoma brucei brucei TREU927]EAN79072.1 hypothetical protein, conserved [Trypanosoma brucei brucei TREU927]
MEVFDLAAFRTRMNDVERDVRVMALFDLQQALKSTVFKPDSVTLSKIVEYVTTCFAQSEPCREVRCNAIRLVPQLLLLSGEKDQERLVSLLCTSSTSQRARFGEKGYSELHDSAARALKLACECMSSKARADVESWQRLVPVARKIADALSSALEKGVEGVVREGIYDCIGVLIYPFGRVFICDVGCVLTKNALADVHHTGQLRRRAISFLSLASPFLSEDLFDAVFEVGVRGLREGNHRGAVVMPYLQLYEGLVKGCPSRAKTGALETMKFLTDGLSARLSHESADADAFDDDDYEVCDATVRLMHLMVCQYSKELATIHCALFVQALEIARFDPNYCDNMGGLDGCDSSDASGLYFTEDDTDMSWRLRMWAARLLALLIELSPFSTELTHQLGCEVLSLIGDRVEEVQLAAIHFVDTVIQSSRGASVCTSLLLFLQGAIDPLLGALNTREPKVVVAAAKALQNLFYFHWSVFTTEVCRAHDIVDKLLKAHLTGKEYAVVELTALAVRMLEGTSHGQPNIKLVTKLLDTVYAAVDAYVCGGIGQIVVCSVKAMAHTSGLAGAAYCERCMELYISLALNANFGGELISSAVEATRHCMSTFAASLSVDYFRRCGGRLVVLSEGRQVAIRLLKDLTASVPAAQLQPQELERLSNSIGRQDRAVQQHIVSIVCNALDNSGQLTAETLEDMFEFARSNSLKSGDRLLVQATLEMLEKICRRFSNLGGRIVDQLLPTVWEILSSAPKCAGHHPLLLVRGTAVLIRSLHQMLEPAQRSDLVEQTLRYVSRSKFRETSSEILRGVASVDEGILERVGSLMSGDDSLLCICVGTIGMSVPLPDMWEARLFRFLSSTGAENLGSVVPLAVGRAVSNAQNRSLMERVVESATRNTGGAALFWRAIHEAALTTVAGAELSPFSDPFFCKGVVEKLMENLLEDDTETAATVLGSFAPFVRDYLIDITATHLSDELDSKKAVCITVQRYLLSSVKNTDECPRLVSAIERALRCLSRKADLRVRFAALQLFATLLSVKPHLLIGSYVRDVVYPCVLEELLEDPTLVLAINLGSCTHREDRGKEMRKLAFECVSMLLRDAEDRGKESILEYCGRYEELGRCLVHACGPRGGGETDGDINTKAMDLIVRFLRLCPSSPCDGSQVMVLYEKLKMALGVDIERTAQDASKKQLLKRQALNCIMCLSEWPPFSCHPQWQSLVLLAQQNPLLPEAIKVT